jgi:hypothetical protein
MSNINGKVYAMNAITPMKPWKTWILRAVFFTLGHVKSLQSDLINLSFIQFARWRWSEKFPGSVPVTGFKEYIARIQFDTDYYYTAYPYATANDVKSAIVVDQALEDLGEQAAAQTPDQFRAAYLEFVLAVQTHLGETGEAPAVF